MTLTKLQQDMYVAMKEGDFIHKEVLSSAIASIKKAAIDKKCKDDIPESLIDEVLRKEYKTIQEQIDTCPKDRKDTLLEYQNKLIVLDMYVPKLISDEYEIEEYINYIIDNYEVDISNTGMAMKTIMPHLKGKCDMKVANSVIKGMCF